MTRLRRFPWLVLAPVLALVALLAWAFASPVGAGPDDDYHLISAWCAGPTAGDTCAPADEPDERVIPRGLVEISCYGQRPELSAGCQERFLEGPLLDDLVVSDRGNFVGEYPPVYYAVLGMFTSLDVQTSALLMRVFTIVLFVALMTALYLLLPVARRATLVVGWLVTTVPLGMFLLASNNPSAWAAIGVGTSWLALIGWFETVGRRRVALGVVYALGVVMAAGSRGDAAVYVGFATALVLVYSFRPERRFLLSAILPVVMGLVALGFLLAARQVGSGVEGFTGEQTPGAGGSAGEDPGLSGLSRLAYNVLNAPSLWTGVFGQWGLGWLDTTMPAVVLLGALGAFLVAMFLGVRRMSVRKAVVVVLAALVLWALPVYVLQQGGHIVGEQVQPRYLLPLIILLGGLLALDARPATWTRAQLLVVAAALAAAHLVALRVDIRRYVTGASDDGGLGGFSLDTGAEWWWAGLPVSPTAVWVIGSVAYAALVALLALKLPRTEGETVETGARRLP